ncbi:NTP transferase domain-containing protein [Parablastomonas sp. CN1-191]|uniref:NTP transferase domain-containing protein n=1 Tax=Parablastomonas sp. CN1-191 TaxID=3400908 RepID=UPI003BF902EF
MAQVPPRPAPLGGARPLIAVLGAGAGRRMGGAKLTRPCAGRPLGIWARDLAAGMPGADAIWIAGPAGDDGLAGPLPVVVNAEAADGIGTSLACAARAAAERAAPALIIMLADMPMVTAALLGRLMAARGACAARYPDGRLGVPARFEPRGYPALMGLHGDSGGNRLLRRIGARAMDAEPGELLDVDTEQALAAAAAVLAAR